MRRTRFGFATLLLLAAVVAPARAAGPPRGIHVAFGDDPKTKATIAWFTDGLVDAGTTAEYGPSPSSLDATVVGTSQRAPGVEALVHEVALSGLTPGSEVFYRVGATGAWSAVRSFRTAPAAADGFRFTVFADHGIEEESRHTTDAVIGAGPDFHLVAGDLSYAQPGDQSFPDFTKWDTWFDDIEPLASSVPVMVAAGNHENETVGGLSSYRARFALPGRELFYSFDYENAHFLVLMSDRTSNVNERALAEQLAFAEADLLAATQRRDAGTIDFIFVVQHHPLYGWQSQGPEVFIERQYNPFLIAVEEHLLHRYDVDVLITGHNHHFMRSKPMMLGRETTSERSSYTNPTGFIQLISGGGGEGLASFSDSVNYPSWDAAHARRFHFTQFDVSDGVMTVRAIASDEIGGVLDTWTLRRS